MAKSKNHTSHNQNRKQHRNGIHRPKTYRYPSMKGVDPKFLKNLKFSKKHNKNTKKYTGDFCNGVALGFQ
uniref:60S ribosomal protein L29 n=2 Tax=Magallana gigas TaxID=29159 RepID=A0A8W8LYQ2_MAGGI